MPRRVCEERTVGLDVLDFVRFGVSGAGVNLAGKPVVGVPWIYLTSSLRFGLEGQDMHLVWLGNFEDASPMYTEVHPRVHLAGEWVDVAWQGTWKAQSEGNCGVNCLVITMMFNTWMVS